MRELYYALLAQMLIILAITIFFDYDRMGGGVRETLKERNHILREINKDENI